MNSLWTDTEAAQFPGDLALRVYTSRLLGRDKSLVLHGGGNTSVKLSGKNAFGEDETLLYVKGSGWDLEKIEEGGFAPVRLEHLKRLAQLPALPDPQMVNELVTQTTRAGAPVRRCRRSKRFCMQSCRTNMWITPTPMPCLLSPTRRTAQRARAKSTAISPW